MAAAGHFGNQSEYLVKHYATDLGFEYLCASSKEEFKSIEDIVISKEQRSRPLLIEVFTKTEDESKALEIISNISRDINMKQLAKNMLGESGVSKVKKLIGKK